MNELTKTLLFIVLAAILVGMAIMNRPTLTDFQPEEMLGKSLFPQFADPLSIKSLEIVKIDAAGERNVFRVSEVNGIWSLPSHDNYPADAKDQMGRVAEALTDLKALEVIQPEESGVDAMAFQTQYGVVDPSGDTVAGSQAMGIKITLGGARNETLVNLIIGKEVTRQQSQDMGDDSRVNLRYVRIANQAPVYVTSIDPSRFSTNFDQWIEKNLLDISTLDIKELFVDQYSFSVDYVLTNQGLRPKSNFSPSGDLTLGYDSSAVGANKWLLTRWMVFEGQNYEYKERNLEPEKELDSDALDSMVSALNDLKIVSVQKKPTKLASALRERQTFETIELDDSMQGSMRETGFWLVDMPDLKVDAQKTKTQLLSNEGDMQLRLKDGIVYHLRFGDLAGTESEIVSEDSQDATPVMGVNRYLFITAEFDSAIIPPPELKPVPEISEEGGAEELEKRVQEKEVVERANQREQERYDGAIESGIKRAEELSDRFADWYYVISEDVYKKIHLTETNVFRVKALDSESLWGDSVPNLSVGEEVELPTLDDSLPSLPEIDLGIKESNAEE